MRRACYISRTFVSEQEFLSKRETAVQELAAIWSEDIQAATCSFLKIPAKAGYNNFFMYHERESTFARNLAHHSMVT